MLLQARCITLLYLSSSSPCFTFVDSIFFVYISYTISYNYKFFIFYILYSIFYILYFIFFYIFFSLHVLGFLFLILYIFHIFFVFIHYISDIILSTYTGDSRVPYRQTLHHYIYIVSLAGGRQNKQKRDIHTDTSSLYIYRQLGRGKAK